MSQSRKSMRYEALGEITTVEVDACGLNGRCGDYAFSVSSYSSKTVRIAISNGDIFDQVSYAVVATPKSAVFEHTENSEKHTLKTNNLQLSIDKAAFRVSLMTTDGNIVNEDEPGLSCGWMGNEASVFKTMQPNERFIGLGEKTGNLDRRGTGVTNWNTDAFAYGDDDDPIYASIPFYIGIHNGLVYGLFLDNSYKSHFNFGASNNRFSSFTVEGGDLNYYLIHGASVAEVLFEYSNLTGKMELPPLWSLGYQQCRYSYYPDAEVLRMAETFREKKIPADVMYLDIHYMQDYKVFTWHKDRFPDPISLKKKLADLGFKLVVITDPGVKKEQGYEPYDQGVVQDIFLKYPDGEDYHGEVWPGWCAFPDFTDQRARAFWSEKVATLMEQGVDGVWNDMNEIATWGQKLPDILEFAYEGEYSSSKRGRNVYGMQMARSAFDGCKAGNEDKRPFVLTRAGFAGIQRYSTIWTGDNVSHDAHMLVGVRLVNSLGLSGVPFAGYDVGGFVGEPSAALFARWIALGAFSPFFRGHSMINSRDAEPWSFGEEVEDISRNYISLRYRLMPYIYSLFREATQTGMPVSRSLAIDYTHESFVYDHTFQNQYLFGPYFLVIPVKGEQEIVKVYLPEGHWYDLHSDIIYEGGRTYHFDTPMDKIPLFVKAGAIFPMRDLVQHTSEEGSGTLEIHCYAGGEGSEFYYYKDNGDGYGYRDGNYVSWKLSQSNDEITIAEMHASNDFIDETTHFQFILHGFKEDTVKINKESFDLSKGNYRFLDPISNFDPFIVIAEDNGLSVKTMKLSIKEFKSLVQAE